MKEKGILIMDEERGGLRLWVMTGVIGLTAAFGYSVGVDRRGKAPGDGPNMEIPLDANAVFQFQAAGRRARAAGEEDAARWFEQVSTAQRERLLTWAARRSGAREKAPCPAAPSPFATAANGG
jgi:hypothetical protein